MGRPLSSCAPAPLRGGIAKGYNRWAYPNTDKVIAHGENCSKGCGGEAPLAPMIHGAARQIDAGAARGIAGSSTDDSSPRRKILDAVCVIPPRLRWRQPRRLWLIEHMERRGRRGYRH